MLDRVSAPSSTTPKVKGRQKETVPHDLDEHVRGVTTKVQGAFDYSGMVVFGAQHAGPLNSNGTLSKLLTP